MKKNWQHTILLFAFLTCTLLLTGCAHNKPMLGTEKTCYGTVTDMAMSVVDVGESAWPKVSRPYITIQFEDKTEKLFWQMCETEAVRGDSV